MKDIELPLKSDKDPLSRLRRGHRRWSCGDMSQALEQSRNNLSSRRLSVLTLQDKTVINYQAFHDDSKDAAEYSETFGSEISSSDRSSLEEEQHSFFSIEALRSLMTVVNTGSSNGWAEFVASVRLVCQEVVPTEICNLWLLNDHGTHLVSLTEDGELVQIAIPEDGPIRDCLENGTPVNQDYINQGRMVEAFDGTLAHARLCVRMGVRLQQKRRSSIFQSESYDNAFIRRSERCVGFLEVLNKGTSGREKFTQQDQLALAACGDMSSLAFSNVWYAENDIISMSRMQGLLETSKSLMSAISIRQIFHTMQSEVPMLTGFEMANLYILDDTSNSLYTEIGTFGRYNIPLKEKSAIRTCLESCTSQTIKSCKLHAEFNPLLDQPPLSSECENMILLPVMHPTIPNVAIGVLQVCDKQESWVGMLGCVSPDDSDHQYLEMVCVQLAVAINTISVFEKATHQHTNIEMYGSVLLPTSSMKTDSSRRLSWTCSSFDFSDDGHTYEFDSLDTAHSTSRPSRLSAGSPQSRPSIGHQRSITGPVHSLYADDKNELVEDQSEDDQEPFKETRLLVQRSTMSRRMSLPNLEVLDKDLDGLPTVKLAENTSVVQEVLCEIPNGRKSVNLSTDDLLNPNLDLLAFSKDQLRSIALAIFHAFELPQKFSMCSETLESFIEKVQSQYEDNPFHNWYHAMTVLHTAFVTISVIPEINKVFTHLDILAIFLTAIAHDMGHTGQTNAFHVQSVSDFAVRYNDKSILEQHSATTLFTILKEPDFNILRSLSHEDFLLLRSLILNALMDTDLAAHGMLLSRFSALLNLPVAGPGTLEDRKVKVSIIVHAADLSNPTRVFDQARTWSLLLAKEMQQQADTERALSMPVAPFMLNLDNQLVLAKNEIHFINTFAQPLWMSLVTLFPALDFRTSNIKQNLEAYQQIIDSGDGCKASDTLCGHSTNARTSLQVKDEC